MVKKASLLNQIWKDPVGSKIISVAIVGLISFVYAWIVNKKDGVTFYNTYNKIYELKFRVVYLIIAIIVYSVVRRLLRKEKSIYSKKQKELRDLNNQRDDQNGVLFKWNVYFDYSETPFIGDLTVFCTKHDKIPIRYIHNKCPINGCPNNRGSIRIDLVKNSIESGLIDRWDNIK